MAKSKSETTYEVRNIGGDVVITEYRHGHKLGQVNIEEGIACSVIGRFLIINEESPSAGIVEFKHGAIDD